MADFTHKEQVYEVFSRQELAIAFYYDYLTGEKDIKSERKSIGLFEYDDDPILSMLSSGKIVGDDRQRLLEYYNTIKNFSEVPLDAETYFEIVIEIINEGKRIPAKMSILAKADDEGRLVSVCGYIVTLKVNPNTKDFVSKTKFSFDNPEIERMFRDFPGHVAVIEFDIRHFRRINEKYGDEAGDECLQYMEDNLVDAWGKSCVASRLGADIFCIFTAFANKEELEERINGLSERFKTFRESEIELVFGVFIPQKDADMPYRNMTDLAAIARKSDKSNHIVTVHYYQEEIGDELSAKNKYEQDLMSGIENREFEVFLQPKCRIRDGKIIGAEALIRWNHPSDGFLTPDKFIPIFEENKQLLYLDYYVHDEVCRLVTRWKKEGRKVVPISCNVSQAYVYLEDLAKQMNRVVHELGADTDNVCFEITETFDDPLADKFVSDMRQYGYCMMMDDFGTGFSSLSNLRDTQFDVIKMDRGFLKDALSSEKGRKIIAHIIHMLNDLNIEIIAEGVETKQQAEFLMECGCENAQGYLYSKPVSIKEFERLMDLPEGLGQ